MPIKIPSNQIYALQQTEVVVAGPEDANRLIIINGKFDHGLGVASSGPASTNKKEFRVLVGPTFTKQQFVQANATASLAKIRVSCVAGGIAGWDILNVDADWDDYSGQVELRIKAEVLAANAGQTAGIFGFSFQVIILAAMPAN